jgi:peptidoglycan/xylan/chitin deacetylase (PgdA/CDA1 family)
VSTTDALLRRSPLQWASERRAASRLAVLAYHRITEPQTFATHLAYLDAHATVISLDDARAIVQGDMHAPPRSVLITFDDADRSLVEHGIPILARHRMSATAFVVAGLLDSDTPFWWDEAAALVDLGGSVAGLDTAASTRVVAEMKRASNDARLEMLDELRRSASRPPDPVRQLTSDEVRTLAESGFSIGSHSLTHPCLDKCTESEMRRELGESRDVLQAVVGEPPSAVAYPNGDRDERVIAAAERAGYTLGFLFDHRLGSSQAPRPLEISRLRVNSWTSPDRFEIIASGLHPALHRVRGRS